MSVWSDAVGTLRPAEGRDGSLPPMLLLLTVVTGLVDATSYLKLGHVFVANMTGNVVFLGFALAGAAGLSSRLSLIAIGAFLVGGVAAGRLGARLSGDAPRLLRAALAVQASVVVVALALAATAGDSPGAVTRDVLIALLALGMGIQNATVRRLAVPELTTTVLTMTLTGISADSALAGGSGSRIGRRGLAVAAMLAGALVGALLVLRVDIAAPLAAAAAALVVAGLWAHRTTR